MVHGAGAGTVVQLLQRPVGDGQCVSQLVRQRLAVGRGGAVDAAAGGGGSLRTAELGLRHGAVELAAVGGVLGDDEWRVVDGGGAEGGDASGERMRCCLRLQRCAARVGRWRYAGSASCFSGRKLARPA